MKRRCSSPSCKDYRWYGGRGITVCKRWLGSGGFENFLADMGPRPDGWTLERIDNSKGYSPENCIWAPFSVQCRNKRSNRFVIVNGKRLILADAARFFGLSAAAVSMRLARWGGAIKDALLTPKNSRRGNYDVLGDWDIHWADDTEGNEDVQAQLQVG